MDLDDVAAALDGALPTSLPSALDVSYGTANTTVNSGNVTGDFQTGHLAVNADRYKVTFRDTAGSTINELYGSSSHSQTRGTSNSNDVLYQTDLTITTSGNLSDITGDINSGLTAAGVTVGPFFSYDSGPDTITMSNTSTIYHITISGAVANDLWNGKDTDLIRGDVPSVSLNGTNPGTGVEQYIITLIGSNTIEEVYSNYLATALSTPSGFLLDAFGLDLSWAIDPTSVGSNDYMGQLQFDYNGNANGKKIVIEHVTGGTSLFGTLELDSSNTTRLSNIVQAKDAVDIVINWEGNKSDGTSVSSSKSSAPIRVYEEYSDNAGIINSALTPSSDLYGLITTFSISDGDDRTGTYLKTGDSWILFTNAAVTGVADTVTIDLYDGGTYAAAANKNGISAGITYNFTDGALDGKNSSINQMVRSARGAVGYEALTHHVEFGVIDDAGGVKFRYGQRENAGDPGEWAMGSGVPAWYGQVYYGGDTTYYFQNNVSPSSVIQNAQVDRQNDVNGTLLFRYDGTRFVVEMKGYARTNASNRITGSYTFTDVDMAAARSGGPVTLVFGGSSIAFTELRIDTSSLSANDKFVVNVAAAAKLDQNHVNTTPASASFRSNVNIAIYGDPLRQSRTDWGTAMQYRFADDTVDGTTLHLLGYVVDPLNGSNNTQGVGWYGGELELADFDNGGYAGASGVGTPGGTDALAYWIRAEVNSHGETEPVASGLITSAFFQKMDSDKTKVIKDFVGGLSYSNYLYGNRGGNYGPLNLAGQEVYNPYNASLIFDVLEVAPDVLKFRIQGHIMDLNGNYWYAEEEEFFLNAGANTFKNSTVQPAVNPEVVGNPVVIFRDSPFGGLYFDEFTLGNIDLWTAGDRFTLSLVASGGEFDPLNSLSGAQAIDELTLLSDIRGTNMPHSFRFYDGVLDHSTVNLRIYQLVNNLSNQESLNFSRDQVMDGTLSVSFGEYFPVVEGADGTVRSGAAFEMIYKRGIDAGIAHFYSKVEDVAQFWDGNGRFILGTGPEILTIRQGDRGTSVAVGAGIELGYLARAISEQVWLRLMMQRDGQLRGADDKYPDGYRSYMMRDEDKYDIFKFVNTVPGRNSKESVVGTFVSHSIVPGEDYALNFYGSEDLMKAFAFNTIQQAEDNLFDLDVQDAHTGKAISSMRKVQAGELVYDLIAPGIAIDLDAIVGVRRAVYDPRSGAFAAEVNRNFVQFVHLADNAPRLQIGANEGENTILVLGDMTVKGLNIENLIVREREEASRSVTRIDNAIDKVSTQRATVGAQVNRLEHTITNLTVAGENLTAAESRIMDADMAREMMNFTMLQIMLQAGTSMLAQANGLPRNVLSLLR
jgi:hypothetical protein